MAWKIEIAPQSERDLTDIADHLYESYRAFGNDGTEAAARANERTISIRGVIRRLAEKPFRGTRHDDLLPGLRHVTIDRAVYWFVADEATETVRILGIFHGGQDHGNRMLRRLTGG